MTTAVPRAARRPRRPLALVAAAALVPVLLAASGCAGSATAAGDREPLTVLTFAPWGTGSADRPGMPQLATAIGAEVNADGGIAGRRLKVLTCNEHNTADGATACAKQAVAAGAIAVVGSYSQFGDAFMPVLENAGIPFIGGYGLSGPEFTSPLSYPVAGGTPALIAGSGRQLAAAGCRSVSLIRPDTPAGDTLVGSLVGALSPAGVKLNDVKAQESSSDFTAVAKAAIGSDAPGNCITAALSSQPTLTLLDSLRRQPHKNTRLFSVIGSFQQSVVDSTGGDAGPLGGAFAVGWFPPEASTVWDQLRAIVRTRAAADASIDDADPGVQTTWVAYQVLLAAIKRVPQGRAVDNHSLRDVLDSGTPIDTGGATPPLAWGLSNMLASADTPRLVNTSVTFQQVQGGRLVEQQPGFIDVRWVLTNGPAPTSTPITG
ncbi:ABC transporter substrate-binding protein [Kitasatospora viridis]|uniref:Amino acid/amide ABC transporter substrate-binding protein (HAAT family) n=1 Tax=Kitasatospora viridis TaxID=281105 RepID=A0A561UGA5_9ACTN|nr:ABC transporter substrate-binding protein [Kitasatospora viridis]TWF98391.1 amino acid/amide ABC transporter substrate-binding protein (HAAT family) [Kitasatospora viridis]